MAVKWEPHRCFESWKKAEKVALLFGREAPLGFLYRFEDKGYSYTIDADAEIFGAYYQVEIQAIPIRSVTPCGWTIEANNGNGWRFIDRQAYKQYACPTVMEALASYVERKKKQAAIYQARVTKANEMIMQAMGITFDLDKALKIYKELTQSPVK